MSCVSHYSRASAARKIKILRTSLVPFGVNRFECLVVPLCDVRTSVFKMAAGLDQTAVVISKVAVVTLRETNTS
jgi:hypothetical protein